MSKQNSEINDYLKAFTDWQKDASLSDYERIGKQEPLPDTQEKIQRFVDNIEIIPYTKGRYGRTDNSDEIGEYVSYCVNEIYPKHDIEIKLNKPISSLGSVTWKNWKITGNAGSNLGYGMKVSGKIKLFGNAGYKVGNESRGIIRVKGNAESAGFTMEEGKIFIEGDCKFLGPYMEGGEIHISGNYENISENIKGGDIYHRGKLIVSNGKLV